MLCTIWYAFKKLSLRQSLCSMISIFASKLLGVVSVILSSNSSSKSKVSTLIEFISEIVLDCPWLSRNVPECSWILLNITDLSMLWYQYLAANYFELCSWSFPAKARVKCPVWKELEIENLKIPFKSLKVLSGPCRSLEVLGGPWLFLNVTDCSLLSLTLVDIPASYWTFWDIMGYSGTFWDM